MKIKNNSLSAVTFPDFDALENARRADRFGLLISNLKFEIVAKKLFENLKSKEL